MKFSDDQMQQLSGMFDKKLKPIKEDISSLRSNVETLKKSAKPIKSMQRTLNYVKKTVDIISGSYDMRINKLEKHTAHLPTKFML